MKVDKYCEDGLFIYLHYKLDTGFSGKRIMLFPINYTEAMESRYLCSEPHCMKVDYVEEIDYCIKLKKEFL